MELWVRSQKKRRLLKVGELVIKEPLTSSNKWYIDTADYCLGEYASEKRCLEILNEIQTILTECLRLSARELTKEGKDKIYENRYTIGSNIFPNSIGFDKIEVKSYVYQMPEE